VGLAFKELLLFCGVNDWMSMPGVNGRGRPCLH
jgi:hypothetical protein